jgi:serine/threonine-protein kinase
MNITEAFVLKNDVVLIPCAELAEDVRSRISYDDGDFTISRRHARLGSQVIDGETAELLQLFRTPRTIVEAVLENSRALRKNPEQWLDELLPHLGVFLTNHVLVPAGSEDQEEIRPQLEVGERFGEWTVAGCISLIEDSELYRLRNDSGDAALKIARAALPFETSLFGNEVAILRHLDGRVGPRLLDSGLHDGRPYLVIEWIDGVDSTIAAAQRRHDRVATIQLCSAVAAAYAQLHACGVIHADVHPRNLLVGADGAVTLLDFGLSRIDGGAPSVGRGGMYYFYEPEMLTANRNHQHLPASFAGEQYSLAALLYLLIAGKHYLEFQFDRDEMARQAETDPPLPFAARGIPPWPEVEQIVFRGLEKNPQRRWPSVAELAERLDAARADAAAEALATPVSDEATALVERLLRELSRGGVMFEGRYPTAPTASINYGSAGAAIGLLRIASVRSDPALLALADVWKSRALRAIGTGDDAWYNPGAELSKEILGEVTPYHTDAGAWAAAAMLAHARGDLNAQGKALDAFLRASQRPCDNLDLTLGRSGTLLATAMLLERCDFPEGIAALRPFGDATLRSIWTALDDMPPLAQCPPDTYLGMAHGWCGYLYAALRWCDLSGTPIPPQLERRLHELAELGVPRGRGTYWRRQTGSPANDVMVGWCNGASGYVFLWTLAHRLLGDDRWLHLAERSAWHEWDQPRHHADLCCGTAGRAYGLLNLYKHTGATEWLSRARQLANHSASAAVETSQRTNTLWKGELGIAVLISDLSAPEQAAMPFFE